jgi:hypothetical protein
MNGRQRPLIPDEESMKRASLALVVLAGCAGQASYIYGTRVVDTSQNRELVAAVEQYRVAVEKKDTQALMEMASKSYWEDAGTPTGSDDYGYDGLRTVLDGRFARADGIRYSMKYMGVRRLGPNKAAVDVVIDASYSIATANGSRRLDMKDQNEMVLEYDGRRWLFLSGM